MARRAASSSAVFLLARPTMSANGCECVLLLPPSPSPPPAPPTAVPRDEKERNPHPRVQRMVLQNVLPGIMLRLPARFVSFVLLHRRLPPMSRVQVVPCSFSSAFWGSLNSPCSNETLNQLYHSLVSSAPRPIPSRSVLPVVPCSYLRWRSCSLCPWLAVSASAPQQASHEKQSWLTAAIREAEAAARAHSTSEDMHDSPRLLEPLRVKPTLHRAQEMYFICSKSERDRVSFSLLTPAARCAGQQDQPKWMNEELKMLEKECPRSMAPRLPVSSSPASHAFFPDATAADPPMKKDPSVHCLWSTLEQQRLPVQLSLWAASLPRAVSVCLNGAAAVQVPSEEQGGWACLQVTVFLQELQERCTDQVESPLYGPLHPPERLSVIEQGLVNAVLHSAPLVKTVEVLVAIVAAETGGGGPLVHLQRLWPRVCRTLKWGRDAEEKRATVPSLVSSDGLSTWRMRMERLPQDREEALVVSIPLLPSVLWEPHSFQGNALYRVPFWRHYASLSTVLSAVQTLLFDDMPASVQRVWMCSWESNPALQAAGMSGTRSPRSHRFPRGLADASCGTEALRVVLQCWVDAVKDHYKFSYGAELSSLEPVGPLVFYPPFPRVLSSFSSQAAQQKNANGMEAALLVVLLPPATHMHPQQSNNVFREESSKLVNALISGVRALLGEPQEGHRACRILFLECGSGGRERSCFKMLSYTVTALRQELVGCAGLPHVKCSAYKAGVIDIDTVSTSVVGFAVLDFARARPST